MGLREGQAVLSGTSGYDCLLPRRRACTRAQARTNLAISSDAIMTLSKQRHSRSRSASSTCVLLTPPFFHSSSFLIARSEAAAISAEVREVWPSALSEGAAAGGGGGDGASGFGAVGGGGGVSMEQELEELEKMLARCGCVGGVVDTSPN